jgi:hypothetical protein
MKVSIDNILGSAQKINSRMRQDVENSEKTSETRGDSVHIDSRVDKRISQLESELRIVQNSISRHQVALDGMKRLRDDIMNGGSNQQEILNNTKFGGKVLLSEFSVGEIDIKLIDDKMRDITNNANQDHANLKKMLVEVDNITAADMLSAKRANELISGVQNEIAGNSNIAGMTSNINVNNVKNLIS